MAGGEDGAGYSPWDVPEGSGGFGGTPQPGSGGHLPAFGVPQGADAAGPTANANGFPPPQPSAAGFQAPMTSFPGVQTQPNPAAGWPQPPASQASASQRPEPSLYLDGPADPRGTGNPDKRRKTLLISAAAALAVVGVAGVIALSGGGSDSKQQPSTAATSQNGVASASATSSGAAAPAGQTQATPTDRNGQSVAPGTSSAGSTAPPSNTKSSGAKPTPSAKSSSAPTVAPPVAAPTADVLHWRLAEPAGSTTAADSSGRALNGTASGTVTFGSQRGGSAFFNGKAGAIKAGEIATAAPAIDTTKSFTVSMWVDQTGLTTPTQYAAAFSQDGAQCYAFTFSYSTQQKAWTFTRAQSDVRDPASDNAVSTSPTPLNTWLQLTGVYDAQASTITLYVDGVPQSTVHTGSAPYAATGPFAIGRSWYQAYPSNPFNGYISDVRVYDRALTAAEVAKI